MLLPETALSSIANLLPDWPSFEVSDHIQFLLDPTRSGLLVPPTGSVGASSFNKVTSFRGSPAG